MAIAMLVAAEVCLAADGFKVVDGDSLEKGAERIRLLDIDAPEYLQFCYDAKGQKYMCGQKATEFMRLMVAKGISCLQNGEDKYGRSLVECRQDDGTVINREMVLNGWAVAYGKKYKNEEAKAREAKRGIWAGRFMRPELYRALKNRREHSRK